MIKYLYILCITIYLDFGDFLEEDVKNVAAHSGRLTGKKHIVQNVIWKNNSSFTRIFP